MKHKSTSATISDPSAAERDVQEWMLAGHSAAHIKEALAVRHPGAKADAVLAAAIKHFEKIGKTDNAAIRGWVLEAYRSLYEKMLAIGDFSNALKAVKAIHDISSGGGW